MILGQNLSNLPGSTDGPGLNFLEKDSCNSTSVTKDLQSIDMFEHNFWFFELRTSNSSIFYECRIFEISNTRLSPVTVVHILILQTMHTNKRNDSAFCCLRVNVKVFQSTFSTTKKGLETAQMLVVKGVLFCCLRVNVKFFQSTFLDYWGLDTATKH